MPSHYNYTQKNCLSLVDVDALKNSFTFYTKFNDHLSMKFENG